MRFNKWPFRRFSLSQLFVDIRNNSSKSFVCPVTSGGETEHTLQQQQQSKMYSLPPSLPLSGVRAPLCRMCLCSARFVWLLCRGECAGPSPTRMGETAPRPRCKQQDHRPITFSGKRWSAGVALDVPSPVQCPHTCRPGFLQVLGFECSFSARLQCRGSETGAQPSVVWRVDGRPVRPHTAFTGSQESHITRPAVAGGRRGGVGQPQNADRSVPSASSVSCQCHCQSGLCAVISAAMWGDSGVRSYM